MLYLDYAKPLAGGGYILSFFTDSAADLESISHGQKFVTKNGTDYGVPQAGSTVIVTSPNSGKTTYVMDAEGIWVVTEDISYSAVVANPSDAATAKLEKLKVNDTTYANWTENEIKALAGKGEDGVSVTSFETVSSTVFGDNTNTTVRAHYSNNTTDEFIVTAKNGKDGSSGGGGKVYKHKIHFSGTNGEIYTNIYSSLNDSYNNVDSVIAILSNEPYQDVWYNGENGRGIGIIRGILSDTFYIELYSIGSSGTVSAKDVSLKITGISDNVTEAK